MTIERLLPSPTPLSAPFWQAVAAGELSVQRCLRCSRLQWTPQRACRSCLSEDLEWFVVSGRGEVYSFSVVTRPHSSAFTAPYVVAIVTLAEGPRILTDLVGVDPSEVTIGMTVRLCAETVGAVGLYHFTADQQARA